MSLGGGTLPAQNGGPKPDGLNKVEQEVVDLTNAERKKENLPPYKVNLILSKVARAYSATMAKEDKVEHDLGGKVLIRVKKAGYPVYKVGENLARSEGAITIPQVVEGWMKSPKHKKNILFPDYTEIGVGTFTDDKGQIWFTQVFATPQPGQANSPADKK
jgi:uncharacterized protein YkwD